MAASGLLSSKLVSKISSRLFNILDADPIINVWILATNSWNDNGKWIDTEFWQD